jgi:Transcriptional antiterminator
MYPNNYQGVNTMKVIKNINNNVSICLDSKNHEVVVFGKGIGFIKPPHEIDISKVQKTFYDLDYAYIDLIDLIPEDIIELSIKIVDYARVKLGCFLRPNVNFTLADHIKFMIDRYKNNMKIKMPNYHDIQHLYPKEFEVGKYTLKLISEKYQIHFDDEEVIGIAIHFMNAEAIKITKEYRREDSFIEEITNIVENYFNIEIDTDSFSYSRFLSHMQYLLKRGANGKIITTENIEMFQSLKDTFPKGYECSVKINQYINDNLKYQLNDEELMYLMLHINRLCAREDCYQ